MNSQGSELSFLFKAEHQFKAVPTFLTDTLRYVLTGITSQVLKIPSKYLPMFCFSFFFFLLLLWFVWLSLKSWVYIFTSCS